MPSNEQNDPRDEIIKSLTNALALMSQTKPKNEIIETETVQKLTTEIGTQMETESKTESIWECCPVCMEEETPAGRVITRCGHSVCLPCYARICSQPEARCPMCREDLPDVFAQMRPQAPPLRLRRAGEIVVNEPARVAREAEIMDAVAARRAPAPVQRGPQAPAGEALVALRAITAERAAAAEPAPETPAQMIIQVAESITPEATFFMYRTQEIANEHNANANAIVATHRCSECKWYGVTANVARHPLMPNVVSLRGGLPRRKWLCLGCHMDTMTNLGRFGDVWRWVHDEEYPGIARITRRINI